MEEEADKCGLRSGTVLTILKEKQAQEDLCSKDSAFAD